MAVSEKDFLAMLEPALGGATGDHMSAVLKRAVIIIAGCHGVYVRLPSERANQIIHIFREDRVGEDWLLDTNKHFLNLYREGVCEEYDGFERLASSELALVESMCQVASEGDQQLELPEATSSQGRLMEEVQEPLPSRPRRRFSQLTPGEGNIELAAVPEGSEGSSSGSRPTEEVSQPSRKRELTPDLASDEEDINLADERCVRVKEEICHTPEHVTTFGVIDIQDSDEELVSTDGAQQQQEDEIVSELMEQLAENADDLQAE